MQTASLDGSALVAHTASDTIERPEPGLARGRWEAPWWMFAAVATAALLGGLVWLARVAMAALRARRPRAERPGR